MVYQYHDIALTSNQDYTTPSAESYVNLALNGCTNEREFTHCSPAAL
jgi:hypothetical protein